jgi:hypothetical protein
MDFRRDFNVRLTVQKFKQNKLDVVECHVKCINLKGLKASLNVHINTEYIKISDITFKPYIAI